MNHFVYFFFNMLAVVKDNNKKFMDRESKITKYTIMSLIKKIKIRFKILINIDIILYLNY
jgi:hypothetical protein